MAAFRVMEEVGRCGEDLAAALLGGRVVSAEYENEFPMDVLVGGHKLGVESKMSNYTHNQRATVSQVMRLHQGVNSPGFVMDVTRGIYALVFYDAVDKGNGTKQRRRKSKIMSRRIKTEQRRLIIAKELEYVYLLDVEVMLHLATHPEFQELQRPMKGKMICDSKKLYREDYITLDLGRTFLKKFLGGRKMDKNCRRTLDSIYGEGKWAVQEKKVSIRFTRSNGRPSLVRQVPVRTIGSKKLLKVLSHVLRRKKEMRMNLPVSPAAIANN